MSSDADFHFASLFVRLEASPSLAELSESDELLESRGLPSLALIERTRLLEEFYAYVSSARARAEDAVLRGTASEGRDALVDLGIALGIPTSLRDQKNLLVLLCYLESLQESPCRDELLAAIREQREPELPRDVLTRAVDAVRNRFALNSWNAARTALFRARRQAPSILQLIPLPPGE